MKPIRQQFIDALGYKGKTLNHYYRNFTLAVVAGMAVAFGEIYGTEVLRTGSAFDLRVAIGCLILVGLCVLFASRRLFVLGFAVMVPGLLVADHAFITHDRPAELFYLKSMAAGIAIFVVGGLAQLLWWRLRIRRSR